MRRHALLGVISYGGRGGPRADALREKAGALLHLRRETNQGLILQHLGRSDYTRTVPDTQVLAVVAARALAPEGFLGRSGAGAGRPGRDRPLP